MRRCFVFALLLGVPAVLVAQPQFRSGIELVTVDVAVTRQGGMPVAGLELTQFTVTVDGTERKAVSLHFVRSAKRPVVAADAPPSNDASSASTLALDRRFVFVVDRDGMPSGAGAQMFDAVGRFIDDLDPTDRVAAWVLPEPASQLAFTQDHEQVKRTLSLALGTAQPPATFVRIAPGEALMMSLGDERTRASVLSRECIRPMLRGPGCEPLVRIEAERSLQVSRTHAERTLSTLAHLMDALASLHAPIDVVLVTGGILETPGTTGMIRDVAHQAAAARVRVHAMHLPASEWFQSPEERMPLTPEWRDLAAPPSAATSIALSTGGFSRAYGVPHAAFERLAREVSASYVLAFEPLPQDRDGKPHRIEIHVSGIRDVTVRARQQFRIQPPPVSTLALPSPPSATGKEPRADTKKTQPELASLLTRAGAYVLEFQREFGSVVAEEHYVQVAKPWRGIPKSPDQEPALQWDVEAARRTKSHIVTSRRIRSDVLLVQMPDGMAVGYRDVFEADGKAVRDRDERVKNLFLSGSQDAREQLIRINGESARYNLGSAVRTVNTPSFPLIYLHPRVQSGVRFSRAGEEVVDGVACVVLEFREVGTPSVVGTRGGADVPAWGRFWMETATGRVRRAEIRLERDVNTRRLVQVSYGPRDSVQVLVPTRMWEWYDGAAARLGGVSNYGPGGVYLECLATYGNFRRFTVTTEQREPNEELRACRESCH